MPLDLAARSRNRAAMRTAHLIRAFALCSPAFGLALCLSCGNSKPSTATDVTAAAVDAAADAPGVDAAPDSSQEGLPTPAERGWSIARNVVHIHSTYSHDACDGYIDNFPGQVSTTCLDDLRVALCESGLDVAFLTDHPSHSKEFGFDKLLQVNLDKGDTPVGDKGAPHANVVHCPKSDALPARDVVLTVGYEGTHNMAIGIHHHFTDGKLQGLSFSDKDSAIEDVKKSVAAIHAAKGVSCNAHSEEDDISVQRMVQSGMDCMEVYNTHANFKTIVGMGSAGSKMNLGRVFLLDKLLGPKDLSPDPDLAVLIMLDIQPEAAFTKWQAVNSERKVAGVIGNDVHQNVVLEAFCGPGGQFETLCDGLVDKYPHLVALLKKGGPVMLADGKRIDDYRRLLRWISNRTLIPPGKPATERAELTKAAIVAARTWAVYDVLGDPQGLDMAARDKATGKWVEVGDTAAMGSTLYLRVPDVQPMPWAHWTAADAHDPANLPTVSLVVWRIAPGDPKAQKLATLSGAPGSLLMVTPDQPGKYHLEVRLVPKHLRKLMKGMLSAEDGPELVDLDERWAVGNPIEIK